MELYSKNLVERVNKEIKIKYKINNFLSISVQAFSTKIIDIYENIYFSYKYEKELRANCSFKDLLMMAKAEIKKSIKMIVFLTDSKYHLYLLNNLKYNKKDILLNTFTTCNLFGIDFIVYRQSNSLDFISSFFDSLGYARLELTNNKINKFLNDKNYQLCIQKTYRQIIFNGTTVNIINFNNFIQSFFKTFSDETKTIIYSLKCLQKLEAS